MLDAPALDEEDCNNDIAVVSKANANTSYNDMQKEKVAKCCLGAPCRITMIVVM